jgi:hypothetical protein
MLDLLARQVEADFAAGRLLGNLARRDEHLAAG